MEYYEQEPLPSSEALNVFLRKFLLFAVPIVLGLAWGHSERHGLSAKELQRATANLKRQLTPDEMRELFQDVETRKKLGAD